MEHKEALQTGNVLPLFILFMPGKYLEFEFNLMFTGAGISMLLLIERISFWFALYSINSTFNKHINVFCKH
jgi:hypothetical protein